MPGGGTFTFHGGAGGPYFGSGNSYPVPELYETGSNCGTTPPVCPDGSMMGPNGCPEEEGIQFEFCTAEKELTKHPWYLSFTVMAYPGDGCNLTGHVQFSEDLLWVFTGFADITNSGASGHIKKMGKQHF